MSPHLEHDDLINAQQMEVAVNGPDGATHLILCTGVARFNALYDETFTFYVGPRITRRQFVGAIASGSPLALPCSRTHPDENSAEAEQENDLVLVKAVYDDEACQVKVQATILSRIESTKIAITYNVNILAELPKF